MGLRGQPRGRRQHRRLVVVLGALLLGTSWIVGAAPPAGAAIVLHPDQGPPSTSVSVSVSSTDAIGCRLLFDGAELGRATLCSSGISFVVPSTAVVGGHGVALVGGGDGAATVVLGTATFTVVAPDSTTTSPSTTRVEQPTTTGVVATTVAPARTTAPTQPPPTTPVRSTTPTTTAGPEPAPAPEAVPTCALAPQMVDGFAVSPAKGRSGTSVSVAFDVVAALACPAQPVVVAIDGVVVSGPLPPGPGAVRAAVVVPRDAVRGAHRIALVAADDPSVVVASASFEVDAPSAGSALPLAAGVLGAVVLAGMAAAVVRARSRRSPKRPAVAVDADAALRAATAQAALAAEAARADVVRAQHAARAAGGLDDPAGRSVGTPFLLGHENPHAPRRPNGKRGWYRTQRAAPVRAIVVRTAPSRQAGQRGDALASGLAFAARPAAAHAVADADAVVDLLPDDHVALHQPEVDEGSIVVLIAADDGGGVSDEALRHAASWSASRARSHHVPVRRVTVEEWSSGQAGFVDAADLPGASGATDGPDFPWDPFLGLVTQADPGQTRPAHADAEADAARRAAEEAERRARAAEQRYEQLLREAAGRATRDIPSPQELVDAAGDGPYYLLDHENSSAALRENGKRGWYYPHRTQPIRGIVLHTAESVDAEQAAEDLAAATVPSAAHAVVDTEAIVALLPDEATALHAAGANSASLGIEFAYPSGQWGQRPADEQMLLARAAAWCGLRARKYAIPVRRVTVEEWEAGMPGFISHAELDPAHRTDPGPDFPWDRFLALTASVAERSADVPGPAGVAPA